MRNCTWFFYCYIIDMDVKQFSLNDVFSLLSETSMLMTDKQIVVVSEDAEEKEVRTTMSLRDFIAMNIAHELIDPSSRLGFDMKKEDVEAAMEVNHYEEVAFPNYEHYGVVFGALRGGKRKTRRRSISR